MSTIRFATLRAFGPELAEAIVAQRAPGATPPREVSIEELRSLPESLSPKAKHRLAVLLGTLTKPKQQPKAESGGAAQSPLQTRIAVLTGALESAPVRAEVASGPIAYAAGSTGCTIRAVGEGVSAAVFPDGRMVTLSACGSAKTWDAKDVSGRQAWRDRAMTIALSGGRLATRAFSDHHVDILDAQYNRVGQLEGHSDRVMTLGELPDGSLVTTSDDGTMKVWDATYACTMTNSLKGNTVSNLAVLTNGNIVLRAVGELVICEPNGRVLETKATLGDYVHLYPIKGLADGRFAASMDDGKVTIFDANCKTLNELVGHKTAVRSMVELPGDHLATGGSDGTIRIWDRAGQCLCTLEGHTGVVSSLSCLADGRIVSASTDGTVRTWSFGP